LEQILKVLNGESVLRSVRKVIFPCIYLVSADSVVTGIRIAVVDVFITLTALKPLYAVAFVVSHQILADTCCTRRFTTGNQAVIDVDFAIESIETGRAVTLVRSGQRYALSAVSTRVV
jgi:hypothetical protein